MTPENRLETVVRFSAGLGVTPPAVRKAIATGRITPASYSRDAEGRIWLDPDKARADLAANTHPSKGGKRPPGVGLGNARPTGRKRGRPPNKPPAAPPPPPAGPSEQLDLPVLPQDSVSAAFAKARAEKETHQAELARMQVEQQAGRLVDIEEVKRQHFALARQVREALLNLPDRIAPELVQLPTLFDAHSKLTAEIKTMLRDLAGTLHA